MVDVKRKVKEDDEKILNPYEYFKNIKGKIQKMDETKLTSIYNNALELVQNYNKTGQKKALSKLTFYIESVMKEKKVLDAGITKFVYKEDIEEYIQNVASKQVVILDIANYERAIPQKVIDAMMKVKDLFDEFYVVCTDYNGEMSKKVQEERREKDPILFGVFLDRNRQAINERFYYIGDWVDEYCDLTLEKMIFEMASKKKKDVVNEISIPESSEELQEQLDDLNLTIEAQNYNDEQEGTVRVILSKKNPEKISNKGKWFKKVKTFIKQVRNDEDD